MALFLYFTYTNIWKVTLFFLSLYYQVSSLILLARGTNQQSWLIDTTYIHITMVSMKEMFLYNIFQSLYVLNNSVSINGHKLIQQRVYIR